VQEEAILSKREEGGQVLVLSDGRILHLDEPKNAAQVDKWPLPIQVQLEDSSTEPDGVMVLQNCGPHVACVSAHWLQSYPRVVEPGMGEHLKVLRAASSGGLPSQIGLDSAEFSFYTLRELFDAGLIAGTPYDPVEIVGRSILNPTITLAGRQYLAELEKQAVPNHAAKPTDAKPPQSSKKPDTRWSTNPYRILFLMVVGGLLLAFAVYLVRNHLGIPL
jgi:hypothetical protein